MKVQPKLNSGNVLFATLFTTGIISLFLGGYLSLVRSENQLTSRSQTWNAAIPVAEAGIEEALTHIRSTFPDVKATGDWILSGGNHIVKTNKLNEDEYYIVGIFPPSFANGTTTPVIVSEGFARLPYQTEFVSRTVKIHTKIKDTMVGMIVVTTASLNGNKLVVDSFNSTNSAFNTNGKYDVKKRSDKVILATLSEATDAIDMGNADVWGKLASPYNGQPPKLGAGSIVGSLAWHNAGNKGLEAGAYVNDVNMTVETPVAPYTSALPPPKDSGKLVLGTGDYATEDLSGQIVVTGNARLLVTKTFSKVSSITIATNASLDLYVAAPDVDISKGILNVEGTAPNFRYYGLGPNPDLNWPGNKTLSAGGNGQFTAMINAPLTELTWRGGGSGVEDFSGACIVKKVNMRGHYSFHFDEACRGEMPTGYVTISWDEIRTDWKTILAKNLTVKDLTVQGLY